MTKVPPRPHLKIAPTALKKLGQGDTDALLIDHERTSPNGMVTSGQARVSLALG